MDDQWLPKHLLFGELCSGRRNRGRPRKRFKDCVKGYVAQAERVKLQTESWRALTYQAQNSLQAPRYLRRQRKEKVGFFKQSAKPRSIHLPSLSTRMPFTNRHPKPSQSTLAKDSSLRIQSSSDRLTTKMYITDWLNQNLASPFSHWLSIHFMFFGLFNCFFKGLHSIYCYLWNGKT